MARPATIRHLYSAGGVVFRKSGAAVEVALIATREGSVWTLPKGLIEKGEEPSAAALREIGEETGLKARILKPLGERAYWFYHKEENTKCRKRVSYFLLECTGGRVEDHGWEVDEARWFEISEALQKVSYRGDREILEQAWKVLKETSGSK
jgi:8-oxo-dGTP diphosphatase